MDALWKAGLFDGKPTVAIDPDDLSTAVAIARYERLADIECGSRVLKWNIQCPFENLLYMAIVACFAV